MAKILLVEDDKTFARTVSDALEAYQFIVEAVHTGRDALDHIELSGYDLLIIDWMLPDITGVEVVRKLRKDGKLLPIIMLTGCNTKDQVSDGIDAGADDYMTKPFHMREFISRVNGVLRRSSGGASTTLQIGDIILDPVKHFVRRGGREIHLAPMDFALLEFFMRSPGQVFSNQVLLSRVWRLDSDASSEGVRTAVRRIRKALSSDENEPDIIENVARVGYRLRVFDRS